MKNEPKQYKHFMFHFEGRNSIDARNINQEEQEYLDYLFENRKFRYPSSLIVEKMYKLWFPEKLI